MLNKKLWLVIGGTGRLGQSLQSYFAKNAIEYIAPTSSELDIRNFKNVRNYILESKPSVVINCAGWTNVREAENNIEDAYLLNGYSVGNLINICDEISCVFAHISTDYVFSGSKKAPYLTGDDIDPINKYGVSKALGEKLIIESGVEKFYIFRTAWLYGEFGTNFIKTIIAKYKSGEKQILVVNDQFGSPTYVTDLASKIVESIKIELPYGIYHTVNSGQASWYDLATTTIKYLDQNPNVIIGVKSSENSNEVQRPSNSTLDTTKWKTLGISEMRPWEEALKFAIPHIVQHM